VLALLYPVYLVLIMGFNGLSRKAINCFLSDGYAWFTKVMTASGDLVLVMASLCCTGGDDGVF
jgi:hypothetical protein